MINDIELRPHKQNWASQVKLLLSRIGFMDVWYSQGVGDINNFLRVFKIRIRDIYVQDWHARPENSNRARFYITISIFQFQNYLDILPSEKI